MMALIKFNTMLECLQSPHSLLSELLSGQEGLHYGDMHYMHAENAACALQLLHQLSPTLSLWEGTCHHFHIDITVQDYINTKKKTFYNHNTTVILLAMYNIGKNKMA